MIIKCKMCGGDLNITEGKTICECDFCGMQQTIPSADNEKKANLFNRANRLRMNSEFDRAATVYASITAEFPEEAEAYWGLCLCKYGIEYVDDPATGRKIPTCHRTLTESIMDDNDFIQACENADSVAKKVYREEAKAIDRLQQDILSIVAKEAPYDVFICYKETAEDGDRTEDSVIAQDIYEALTSKGLKVFFSRITLEDKLGQQYEPYIYAALHSSKVMLAVGTRFEYFDAVWVKNEWARFLNMMRSDSAKTLVPCYKEMDAYDMPREFKNLQAQDMSKLGWLQDLTRGVIKLCGKDEGSNANTKNVDEDTKNQIATLLLQAKDAYDTNDRKSAEAFCSRIIEIDPTNHKAWLYKGMSAGWQSTLGNPRVEECALALAKAVQYAPESDVENTISTSTECMRDLCYALISMRMKRFESLPTKENVDELSMDIARLKEAVTLYATQSKTEIKLSEITGSAATRMNNGAMDAWNNQISPEFPNYKNFDFPSTHDLERYVSGINACVLVIEQAVELCDDDDAADVTRYNNLIYLHEHAMDACSWRSLFFNFSKYSYDTQQKSAQEFRNKGGIPEIKKNRVWVKDKELTDEGIEFRRKSIQKYRSKINEIESAARRKELAERAEKERQEREAAEKRKTEYWLAHAEEKAQLEQEHTALEAQIKDLREKVKRIQGDSEIEALRKTIATMENEKSQLGLFKGKQKKELESKIADANQEIAKIRQRMSTEKDALEKEISPLQKRLNDIDFELRKDR